MGDINLLGISGSLRAGSVNTKLLQEAARVFEPASFTLGDVRLPLYDGDLEDAEGIPTAVQILSDQIKAADAVILCTPEYNQSFSGVIKNALDWVSRTDGSPWLEKPVYLMSAAAGRAGGARAAYALRLAMATFRPWLVPAPEMLLANAGSAFDEEGRLKEERLLRTLTQAMEGFRAGIERLSRD